VDLQPLGSYALQIVNAIRATYTHRMSKENLSKIGTGRGIKTKRDKPGRKKG
jgi:hypothetical protein